MSSQDDSMLSFNSAISSLHLAPPPVLQRNNSNQSQASNESHASTISVSIEQLLDDANRVQYTNAFTIPSPETVEQIINQAENSIDKKNKLLTGWFKTTQVNDVLLRHIGKCFPEGSSQFQRSKNDIIAIFISALEPAEKQVLDHARHYRSAPARGSATLIKIRKDAKRIKDRLNM